MKDVCLVYTNTNTQGRLGTHVFDLVLPPLGLAYLAAVLEAEGYRVEIIDANALRLSREQLLAQLENRFKIVGFYCHTQNYPEICELARRLKRSARPPKVILGGPHATAMPEECLEGHPELDALCIGEGEATIVELVPALLADQDLSHVAGITYHSEGRVVRTAKRPFIQDIDTIPMPAWHLLPMHLYKNIIESGGRRVMHVMGSRGCPSDCNYCFSTKQWSSKVRWHSAERVLAECEHLRQHYGIEFFEFFDDIFTLNKKRFRELAWEFRNRGYHWCCSTRIDQIDDETIAYLKLGRVHHICIGIETVNERLLKVIGKGITKAQIVRAIRKLADNRINVLGLFILGIPSETWEEAMETIRFAAARENRFFFAVFSHMTIFPGTNFWTHYAGAHGLSDDFSEYCISKNFSFVEAHRTKEELEAEMRIAYLKFYVRPQPILMLLSIMARNPHLAGEMSLALGGVFLRLVREAAIDKLLRGTPEPRAAPPPPPPIKRQKSQHGLIEAASLTRRAHASRSADRSTQP